MPMIELAEASSPPILALLRAEAEVPILLLLAPPLIKAVELLFCCCIVIRFFLGRFLLEAVITPF